MKVKAIKDGYYDISLRPEGSVFTIASEDEFSPRWMEALEPMNKVDPVIKPKTIRRRRSKNIVNQEMI